VSLLISYLHIYGRRPTAGALCRWSRR